MYPFGSIHDRYESHRPENGGTFITNFGEDDRAIYEAAVKEYGDPNLVIREPISFPAINSGSLHDLTAKRRELGPFWEVFYRLKGEATKAVSEQSS